jgi:hypothetical protein
VCTDLSLSICFRLCFLFCAVTFLIIVDALLNSCAVTYGPLDAPTLFVCEPLSVSETSVVCNTTRGSGGELHFQG